MSNLFSNILSGLTKTFAEVEGAIEDTWAKATAAFPVLKTDEAAAVSALKQQASNAFAFVDTDLAPHYADAVSMVESAGDTLVMAMTHGAVGPGLPLLNVGISQGFDLLRAVIDHAEADAKAKFSLPAPDPGAAAVIGALAGDAGLKVAPANPS